MPSIILKTRVNPRGYEVISLYAATGDSPIQKSVHRIAFRSFNGEIDEKMDINHRDGDKLNNAMSNLEVCTKSENALHRNYVLGKNIGSKVKNALMTDDKVRAIRALMATGVGARVAGEQFGIKRSTAAFIFARRSWKHVS